MIKQSTQSLMELYMADEVAWLDAMIELIDAGQIGDLDFEHLKEYLQDLASRDRKDVKNRSKVLIAHVLKWKFQEERRSNSWRSSVTTQRQALEDEFSESQTLRNHAEAALPKVYAQAVEWAADETGLPKTSFPPECPWTLEQLLSPEVLEP
jgi:Domain of unknown function DUF29